MSSVNSYLPDPNDRSVFEAAINLERPSFRLPSGVTGISVPHHLLAADLIARGFWAASDGDYERVILLSPDHFRSVRGRFAVVNADFTTAFGAVQHDRFATRQLLDRKELFEALQRPQVEHGVQAIIPFVRQFFPKAKVVAVVASVKTGSADWADAAEALLPLVTTKTLVVQSTDYSHYLPLPEAIRRDQETLATLAAGDPNSVANLSQPGHMDSKAAQFIQMRLQAHVGSHHVIIANRNSVEYAPAHDRTTSYIVSAYLKSVHDGSSLRYPDQSITYFGGDVLLGRYLSAALSHKNAVAQMISEVSSITRGTPLIINLEGALLQDGIIGLGDNTHQMLTAVAAPVLSGLGVTAASLANNHSKDFGEVGYEETVEQLTRLGIRALTHGTLTDMGAFRIVALNFVRSRRSIEPIMTTVAEVSNLCKTAADPPLVAFVHWGEEYTTTARHAEDVYSEVMRQCGVALIVGAHSHRASLTIEPIGGETQRVFSLGNLIFDQSAPRSSGALLEVRVFQHGTVASRLVPIPNLFDKAKEAVNADADSIR